MCRSRLLFAVLVAVLAVAPLAVAQEPGSGGPVRYDRTLRLQVQLPPELYAGIPQPLHCAVSGTAGRSVELTGTVRRAGTAAATATRLFAPVTIDGDRVVLPRVELPASLAGPVTIEVIARVPQGIQRLDLAAVVLPPPLTTTIVTDKPLYQPGQTVHIRALSFDPLTMTAAGGRPATVEIRNPQGLLVWRGEAETDEFGLFSRTFTLAPEVPTGPYEIRVAMPPNEATQTFLVRRYQLPKFLIDVQTDKGFYLPDEELRLTISARYTFGEPVRDAEAQVRVVAFNPETQAEQGTLLSLTGRTNDEGTLRLQQSLPRDLSRYFGERSRFPISVRVVMTDAGGLTEMVSPVRLVAREPLQVQLLPEGGALVPGQANRVFVVVSYPDGTPAPSTVEIPARSLTLETDDRGLGEFSFTPAANGRGREFFEADWTLRLVDNLGNRPELRWRYAQQVADGGAEARVQRVRLRPRQAVGLPNRPVTLEVLRAPQAERQADAPRTVGYTYEVRKQGVTLLAREVTLAETQAAGGLVVGLPETLLGQVDVLLHEWVETADGRALRPNVAAASVYRWPDDAVDVEVAPSAVEFAPGDSGRITFRATRRSGQAGPVVLGVDIVDTALFGLIPEERERLDLVLLLRRNVFEDALTPHFADAAVPLPERDRVYRVLAARHPLHAAELAQRDSAAYARSATRQRLDRLRQLIDEYSPYFSYRGRYHEPFRWLLEHAEETELTEDDLVDAWGNEIRFVERYGDRSWQLVSPGPDGQTNPARRDDPVNDDDLVG